MSDTPCRTQARAELEDWQGLPAIRLYCANGDSALIALQGAQVLSWVSGGREQLFLSPKAAHDGHSPIRGGIPVCFPQFNQRGPLVKHGFARSMRWQAGLEDAQIAGEETWLTLRLTDTEATRAVWPFAFEALLLVQLASAALTVRLEVHNRSAQPLSFTAALHSYLRVPQIEQVQLQGLAGLTFWNAAADTHPVQQGAVRFGVEVDSVYPRPESPMHIQTLTGSPLLQIQQSQGWSETVVWNPGPLLCAQLADMEAGSYQQMLCVEAAAIDAPVVLPPDGRWQAAQHLLAFADPGRVDGVNDAGAKELTP